MRVERDVFGRVSVKHRSAWKYRKQSYGISYNILTGEEISPEFPLPENKEEGASAYFEVLKEKCDATGWIIGGDGENVLKMPSDYWQLATPSADVYRTTTSDVQKTVCAALNSRTKLVWFFGVSSDFCEVEGCHFEEGHLQNFVLGIVFAMANEFFPPLDQSTVKVQVIPVYHLYDSSCCIIKMTVDSTTSRLYQLSSGRIFYLGYPGLMESFDQARKRLVAKKRMEIKESGGEPITLMLPATSTRGENFWTIGSIVAAAILGFVLGGL